MANFVYVLKSGEGIQKKALERNPQLIDLLLELKKQGVETLIGRKFEQNPCLKDLLCKTSSYPMQELKLYGRIFWRKYFGANTNGAKGAFLVNKFVLFFCFLSLLKISFSVCLYMIILKDFSPRVIFELPLALNYSALLNCSRCMKTQLELLIL